MQSILPSTHASKIRSILQINMNNRNVWVLNIIEPIILPRLLWKKQKSLNYFVTLIVILWFHLALGFMIKMHFKDYRLCDSSICQKTKLSMIVWDFCIAFMWYSLALKRRKVKKLIKEYYSFQRRNDTILKKSRIILNVITISLIGLSTVFLVFLMVTPVINENYAERWYDNLQLPFSNIFGTRLILFLYFASAVAVYLFFAHMLYLFHIALLVSVLKAINLTKKMSMRLNNKENVDAFMRMYTEVHKLSATVESAVSQELFFMSSYECSFLFLAISFWVEGIPANAMEIIRKSFLHLQFLLFVVMVFVASEIHGRDISLKIKIKDIAFRMSLSSDNSQSADLLSRFLDSKSAIIFTAWKMFSFTRSFFLTSIGVFLTYSFLLLQQ